MKNFLNKHKKSQHKQKRQRNPITVLSSSEEEMKGMQVLKKKGKKIEKLSNTSLPVHETKTRNGKTIDHKSNAVATNKTVPIKKNIEQLKIFQSGSSTRIVKTIDNSKAAVSNKKVHVSGLKKRMTRQSTPVSSPGSAVLPPSCSSISNITDSIALKSIKDSERASLQEYDHLNSSSARSRGLNDAKLQHISNSFKNNSGELSDLSGDDLDSSLSSIRESLPKMSRYECELR